MSALEKLPNNPVTYAVIAHILMESNRWEEALKYYEKSLELDPNTEYSFSNLIGNARRQRKWDLAHQIADQYLERFPESYRPILHKVNTVIESTGDTEQAYAILDKIATRVKPPDLYDLRSAMASYDRDFEEALRIIELSGDKYYLLKAEYYQQLGNNVQYLAYLDSAKLEYEHEIDGEPENAIAHSQLGIVYAHLGRKEEALREGKRGTDIWPYAKYKVKGDYRLRAMAIIHIILGNNEEALDILEPMVRNPSDLHSGKLKLSYQWDPLRSNPRFQKLVAGE